jgi:hypothetical protein
MAEGSGQVGVLLRARAVGAFKGRCAQGAYLSATSAPVWVAPSPTRHRVAPFPTRALQDWLFPVCSLIVVVWLPCHPASVVSQAGAYVELMDAAMGKLKLSVAEQETAQVRAPFTGSPEAVVGTDAEAGASGVAGR